MDKKQIIISLSGRKRSGKSELAKICEQKGFKILHFADSLKNLICSILDITRTELDERKEILTDFKIPSGKYKFISNETGIDFTSIVNELEGKWFISIRDFLQYFGTDIIRKYNPEWHIQQMECEINCGGNFCIDDTRFKNELEFLKNKGSINFYIIRPENFDISNHESEINIKWFDIENTVINNIKLQTLHNKWSNYIDSLLNPVVKNTIFGFNDKMDIRSWLTSELETKSTIQIANENNCSRDKIVWWANKLMVNIPRNHYTFNKRAFSTPTELHSYVAGLLTADGCITTTNNTSVLKFSSTDPYLTEMVQKAFGTNRPISKMGHKISGKTIYSIDTTNSFIIENLKHWNLKPNKSMKEEFPDILKGENVKYIKNWLIGLIDGMVR